MIEVDLKKALGDFTLNLRFRAENEILALLGASGSGKSMTLKCIAGVERPDEGRIVLNGNVLFDSERKINLPPQKRGVGYLFQNYALFPIMTVEENVASGIRRPRRERGAIVDQILKTFCLDGLEKRFPSQLSGGQQQRVAIARILASEPKILMLDEPFSALDSHLRWKMEQELQNVLCGFPWTTLYVSHNRDEVYRLCDRIAVLSDGKLDVVGEKWELFREPKTLSAAMLTGCKNISASQKLSDHRVRALDWGVVLQTDRAVPDDLRYIGVRAHYWIPTEEQPENTVKGKVERVIEDTFSYIVLYRPESGGEHLIRWDVPKTEGGGLRSDVGFLCVRPEDILLLTG
jgi:molybdate transport system ATP-binding protein